MIVTGSGGTGKSQIINAIIYYFQITNRLHMLGRFAPTAKAASLISGVTVQSCQKKRSNVKHTEDSENIQNSHPKNTVFKKKFHNNYTTKRKTKQTLQEKFGHIRYALCDEFSVIGKS